MRVQSEDSLAARKPSLRTAAMLLFLLAAAVVIGAIAAPPASADRDVIRATGDLPVQGADSRYRLRITYAVPGSWRTTGRRGALRRRFGPIGSCRIRATISAAVVADAPEEAVARVSRLLPPGVRTVYDYGTRANAAYRVFRTPGTGEIAALLVKPAPTVKQQPAPGIAWIELRARAVIGPRTECHSGGPITVGQALGDAFAAARVGGFQR